MAKIKKIIDTKADLSKIDWQKVEERLGFTLHKDLKEFYSRVCGVKKVEDTVDFVESKFVRKTGNERYDTWFSFNDCEGEMEFEMTAIASPKDAADVIEYDFTEWTGRNDFGHRAMIGQFYCNIGEILILFNNDTGRVEWIDCGFGYFDVYEENPNGVLGFSLDEFLEKLVQ